MTPEEELKLNKKSVTTTQVPDTKQEIAKNEYQPQYDKFEYKADNPSYLSIMQQARQHKDQIEDREKRAQRVAKFTAWSDFANSLMQLAGGGYSNPIYKPSPYLTKAFEQIDKARSDKEEADRYYSALESKLRSADYNTQLKYHNAQQVERNKYGFQAGQKIADAKNAQNLAITRNNTTKTTQEFVDPTKQNKELELRERQINIQQQNANANTLRAEKSGTKSTKELQKQATVATFYGNGGISTISKENAEKLVKRAKADYKMLMDNEAIAKDDAEKELRKTLLDADMNPDALKKAALMLMRIDREGKYRGYWQSAKPKDAVKQPTSQVQGSFLPPKKTTNTKRNLLD